MRAQDPLGFLKSYRPPERFVDDSLQEAYLAHLNGDDPILAMRAYVRREQRHEQKEPALPPDVQDGLTSDHPRPKCIGYRSQRNRDGKRLDTRGWPLDSAGKPYRGQRAEVPFKDPCEGCGERRRYCLCTCIH